MFRNIAIILIILGAAAFAYFNWQGVPGDDQVAVEATSSGEGSEVSEGVVADSIIADDIMAFMRLEVSVASDTPEACLVFSQDLDESGETRYEDYLRLEPAAKPALRIAGRLLCLGGLSFNQTYQVTLREGLPSASAAMTAYDELVPVELRDRPAAVAFGGGIILPRDSGGSVPLTTMNVDTLSLRVLRVGDRLLARLRQGLLDQSQLYRYDANEIENEQGSLIWEGEMDVARVANQAVTTRFPISEVLEGQGPGAYLILAQDGADAATSTNYWQGQASQWVIETDLGLTTFMGDDGLRVFVRSLENATSVSSAEITLIARNNEILGTRRTGNNGAVRFEEGLVRGLGGQEPVAVMAYGRGGDFTFLDLRRGAFDFSDRGVSGRNVAGPIDAYLYTDRGVYRPGEVVQLASLMRDNHAIALEDVPLTLIVRRPDGMEVSRFTTSESDAGAVHHPITLSATSPLGMWRVSAYVDTDAAPVGTARFEVQNFVPERLEVIATPAQDVLHEGDDVRIDVSARFLYGAPARGLRGEAELRLERDTAPFEGYEEYSFGRIEEALDAELWPLSLATTDATGMTTATGSLRGLPPTTWPLRARARIAIFEPGGRATQALAEMAVRTGTSYIGIRPAFEGRYVRQNTAAAFEVISVDNAGTRTASETLSWQIIREVVNYQWYQLNGEWRFERVVTDRPVAAGHLDTTTDSLAEISETLAWGTYRVIVSEADGEATSSQRFYVGWWGASSADRPDQLVVTSAAESYVPGTVAEITIRPVQAGPALVVVANDRVLESRQIDVPEDGAVISLDVTEEWGAGAYVLVTHYRPLSEGDARAPVRSVGLTWVDVDHQARVLEITLDAPEVVAPEQQITIPVQVTGMEGEAAYLTLAAVDQGIVQLTQFEPPNPDDYYFGKRRLGVDMRDDYGRLIQSSGGALGVIRSGGDSAFGGAGLTVVPTRTVALFSGLVELDTEGRAEVTLDIPDFAGELRLMAVAVSATKVGQTDQRLTVRDVLVGELSLPRFLAPSDRAQATLSVHNVEGPAGTYQAAVTTFGTVEAVSIQTYALDLEPGQRQEVPIILTGTGIGIGTVQLELTGPADISRTRSWPIEVRAAQRVETREVVEIMETGTSYTVPTNTTVGFVPSTANVSLSLSTTRGLDTGGLLRALDRYPFGCLEQTVSRAFPLLYFADLATQAGLDAEDGLVVRQQNAINRVLDMQRGNGAFGMWGYQSGEADAWISLYALEFLFAADAQGFVVPDEALRRGLDWAANLSSQAWRDVQPRAYAFYILASQGRVVPGDLRYFHDTSRASITDAMALAHLGAALDAMGDRARAAASFDQAVRIVEQANPARYAAYRYGSLTRDTAGVTALAARSGRMTLLPGLFDRIGELYSQVQYTTTQEKASLLFAAYALSLSGAELEVTVENAAVVSGEDPVFIAPTASELAQGVSVLNEGGDIWRVLTSVGVPAAPQEATSSGFSLTRTYHRPDGTPADLSAVRQNDRIVVLIQGQMENNIYREMAVMDLLPAGFEIETVLSSRIHDWLPELTSTRAAEARDDRFVAAFDRGNRYRPHVTDSEGRVIRPSFAVAYVARAITPGTFVQPPAYAEDMYAPRISGRTAMGTVTITAQD